MRTWRGVCLTLFLSFCLSACSKQPTTQVQPLPDEDNLNKPIEVSVPELLDRPRKELSALEDEYADRVAFQARVLRERPRDANLIDQSRLPLELPVWHKAKYYPQLDLSLPPYLPADRKDNALARHLARFGDLEGAKKIADPEEVDALTALHQELYGRNYPVEWTRLIVRLQHLGHLRLVTGEKDGATLLMEIHAQLTRVLDDKARKSPLGEVLLLQGRATLAQAEAAWRGAKKDRLAEQVKTALDNWGEVPVPSVPGWLGKPRAEVAALLGHEAQGVILTDDANRALDVLCLPFPREQAEGVAVTFDRDNRLREIVVCYQPGVGRLHSGPAGLAGTLEEQRIQGQDQPNVLDVRSRTYHLSGAVCEVYLLVQNPHVGGIAVLRREAPKDETPELHRDFGLVHLDAGFEFNRHQLNPQVIGDTVESKAREELDDIEHPVPALNPLVSARIGRAAQGVATDRLVVNGDRRRVPLHHLAGPLWQEVGLGIWKGVEDKEGGYFAVCWEDKRTAYTLRLPVLNSRTVEWEAADRGAGNEQAKRDQAAAAFDLARRKERIELRDSWDYLPRSLQIHSFKLGDPRSLVQKALPQAEKTPYGLRYVFPDKPPAVDTATTSARKGKAPVRKPGSKPAPGKKPTTPEAAVAEPEYTPRQLLLRFDNDDRLAEIRLFLQENTARNGSMTAKYQALFGVNPPVEAPWTALWKDLPPMKPEPLLAQWRDDQTIFTCQRAGFGTELVIRDCPLNHPEGKPLPALEYLGRGPDEVELDQTRDEVLGKWKGLPPKPVAEDPLILEPRKAGRYDAFYVWFTGGKVSRVVARHSSPTTRLSFPELTQAITVAWGPHFPQAGFWIRCDLVGDKTGQYVRAYGWADSRTRLRLYWQDDGGVLRLFTEWTALAQGE